MAVDIDESEWPLVKLRWTGRATDEEALAMLARIDDYLARGTHFGLLIDARGASGLSPELRNRVVAHMKSTAALAERLLVQASVIDNPVQRTLFYGIHLLFPRPFPSKVFSEPAAALAWLSSELEKRAAQH